MMDSEEILKKWLNNTLSETEQQLYSQRNDVLLNRKIIEGAQQFKASNFSEVTGFDAFKSFYEEKKGESTKRYRLTPFIRIASVVVIALGIYYMFFFNHLTQVHTMASEKQTIELPDHSIVTLNSLSQIVYHKKDWQDNRLLELQGEAYFKVTKGSTFKVVTDLGTVIVVGTQFNVKQRNDYFEVKCFEGKVKVTIKNESQLLDAGDTYKVLNGEVIAGQTKAVKPMWTEDMSVFEAMPITEVFKELERQYDVEISGTVSSERLFTGGFVHDNLENALIAITKPMNLVYEMKASNLIVIHEKRD